MVKQLRWSILGIALAALGVSMANPEPSTALGCWRRPLLRRQACPPTVIVISEPIMPEKIKESVKEPAKEEALPPVDKDLRVNVKTLANLYRQKETERAAKFAQLVAPTIEDFTDLEQLYRQRNRAGLGWGPMPGKNPMFDGLERGILNLTKTAPPPNDIGGYLNNEEASYWIIAIAELTIAKAPRKDLPQGKTRAFWIDTAKQLRAAGLDLANASAGRDPNQTKRVAARMNSVCIACHAKFK